MRTRLQSVLCRFTLSKVYQPVCCAAVPGWHCVALLCRARLLCVVHSEQSNIVKVSQPVCCGGFGGPMWKGVCFESG